MSRISTIARYLLILHGLANIAQGIYAITNHNSWRNIAPPSFAATPDAPVQAIGLGALGVGWYQFIFTFQNNRQLLIATIPLRLVYAAVVARWGEWKAVGYELVVWGLANCVAFL